MGRDYAGVWGSAPAAEARPIHYHWMTDTKARLRRALDRQTYVWATLDTAQTTQMPWTIVKPDNNVAAATCSAPAWDPNTAYNKNDIVSQVLFGRSVVV